MKLSVLVSARKDSKYLAKFLFGLLANTVNWADMDVHVMCNEHDTWNHEMLDYFTANEDNFYQYAENMGLGRAGLHEYFNMMVPRARGDWLVYFCDDHFISMPRWDTYVDNYIEGAHRAGDSDGKVFPLDPAKPWVLIPKFDNTGSVNHIVSRGFVNALNGKLGCHGWIDSYINNLITALPQIRLRMDEEMFHDFTADVPSPMHEAHLQSMVSKKGAALPKIDGLGTAQKIGEDIDKLERALEAK